MDCTEVEEGYKVRYTPLSPGEYYASIKYNNNHIVGSPFKIYCTGKELEIQKSLGAGENIIGIRWHIMFFIL